MSHPSTQLRRLVLAVILALSLALPAVGGTMAQEKRNAGATVDTSIQVVPPTDETGLVVFIVVSVEGPAGAAGGERLFRHDYSFSIPG